VAASTAAINYDPVKDFAPVSMLGSSPFVLALYPGVAAQTVPERIALAKAKPRALNYASAGPATLAHLSGALFAKMAQVELTHVPYRGTAQSTLDLLEGRVEMQFGTIPPTLTHIRAGKLRALAVTGATRNATLPDVPTIAESGLPSYECRLGEHAPHRNAGRDHRAAHREANAILNVPMSRRVHPGRSSPSRARPKLGARIRDDVKKWREVIISAGIGD
jgi:tripartite-type tricarboxylate transporter receptor subunit TctC